MTHLEIGTTIFHPIKKGWIVVCSVPQLVVDSWIQGLIHKDFRLRSTFEFFLYNNEIAVIIQNEKNTFTDIALFRKDNVFFIINRSTSQ